VFRIFDYIDDTNVVTSEWHSSVSNNKIFELLRHP